MLLFYKKSILVLYIYFFNGLVIKAIGFITDLTLEQRHCLSSMRTIGYVPVL